jgi:dihydrofolate synthase/folylpolyglutamate synthase
MNYNETINFIYSQHPAFERSGGSAYKPGLQTSKDLDDLFGNPHRKYKTIHVAGTNGKGSVSHIIATILQLNGYKVGLYTSPHLVDFRERIKVNGEMITKQAVVDFIEKYNGLKYSGKPSFFELTSTMAFDYFAKCDVDYAVIEVGLGGRLDSTNIITPIMSIITNISMDHMQFLGNTLCSIANEKAGIIKENIPAVIGEYGDNDVKKVFDNKALKENAPITFAEEENEIVSYKHKSNELHIASKSFGEIIDALNGDYQVKNANTVLVSILKLRQLGLNLTNESVKQGFSKVCEMTGLMGRWMKLNDKPFVVCDTGHNIGGFNYLSKQLNEQHYDKLRIVIGFVKDKDIESILKLLPKNAVYYFTNASIPRALDSNSLKEKAAAFNLNGSSYDTVIMAYKAAINDASSDDMIFIGGSTYVVAELLANR